MRPPRNLRAGPLLLAFLGDHSWTTLVGGVFPLMTIPLCNRGISSSQHNMAYYNFRGNLHIWGAIVLYRAIISDRSKLFPQHLHEEEFDQLSKIDKLGPQPKYAGKSASSNFYNNGRAL